MLKWTETGCSVNVFNNWFVLAPMLPGGKMPSCNAKGEAYTFGLPLQVIHNRWHFTYKCNVRLNKICSVKK